MVNDGAVCENVMYCPKCRWILREVVKEVGSDKEVGSNNNLGAVGKDMYCDKCKGVMMTIFE